MSRFCVATSALGHVEIGGESKIYTSLKRATWTLFNVMMAVV